MRFEQGKRLALLFILIGIALACRTADVIVAEATLTPTRTPRPTRTPVPTDTATAVPTDTPTEAPTDTPTRKPVVVRPRTPTPKPAPQPVNTPGPTVSNMEFHANAPFPCTHAGNTYIKGTVYLDKNDPNSRYSGAIVALGPPDGSTVYATYKTGYDGVYAFILSAPTDPAGAVGYFGVWLVTPSMVRKSDIGGPIHTNGLPASDPTSCWASGVDFWK